jgi:cilia- and flagella-associated protein 57
MICISGGSWLRLFKVEEYTFKPLEEVRRIPKGRRITAHAWYKKKMIVAATDKCEILILEEARPNAFEIRQEYHNVFNEAKFDRLLPTAICTFSKGFILGSNTGKFCLWTRKEDSNTEGEEALELSRKWSTTD